MEIALNGDGTLSHQIYESLKVRILEGLIPGGTNIPSTRSLAESLNLSRGTVILAYENLVVEGFIVAHGRRGFKVSSLRNNSSNRSVVADEMNSGPSSPLYWRYDDKPGAIDFRSGLPNQDDFPADVWERLARQCIRSQGAERYSYPFPEGSPELRQAIASYLNQHRGMRCTASNILIVNGAQQAYALILRSLQSDCHCIAIEDPGYRGFKEQAKALALKMHPCPLDEEGLMVDQIPKSAGLVYTTPAHQFPMGMMMSIKRRQQLLEWAAEHKALIIEDDYDSEYRFSGLPSEPLLTQSLREKAAVHNRVLMVGSFSKTIFPSLRLGFILGHTDLINPLIVRKTIEDAGTSILDQAILTRFIQDGHYHRHLRKSRRNNARRHQILINCIEDRLGSEVIVGEAKTGLHITLSLPRTNIQTGALKEALSGNSVLAHPLSSFALKKLRHEGLVLGFSRLSEQEIVQGVERIRRALYSLR
jgi:GntR family transcriptional regulator / MocR family aminotransferase